MTRKEADELWDDWERAREVDPQLTPERFAERQDLTEDDLDQLRAAIELTDALDLPPLVDLGAGDRFASFELLSVLGKGASGIVFVARDEAGRRVALKVLNPLTTVGPAARQSLNREVEVAARLRHPGIVGVLASGQERGYTWIATELVEDATPIGEGAKLDPTELAIQIAEALCAAHELSVVHRDLKPGNVLIDTAGRVRVIDFGLAQVEGAAFAISRTGVPIGTPLYMAPEQLRGEPADPRSDLYSLGLILLEVSVGRSLDLHGGIGALARIASGQHRFPRSVLSAAPARLRGVIARCLEPEPRHRYRDAASLLGDLRAAAEGRPLPIGPRPRVAVAASRVGETLWRVRRPVSALLAMLLLGRLGFWLWGPVAVDLYYTGEDVVVEIDGTRLDVGSGDTLSLARGQHRFRLRSATQSGDLFTLEGSFTVTRRAHAVDLGGFPVLLGDMDPPVPGADWGVLVISTPDHHLRPEVYLDDEKAATVLDRPTTHLPVTLGKHTLRIHWSGRDEVIEFEQTVDRYTAIDVVQPSDPGWRDVVIGSHRDHRVERIVAVNAAPRIWSGPPSKTASGGLTVTHTAYEQVDRERPGSVTVFIRLPSAAEHLQLLHLSHAGVGGVEVEGRGNLQTTVEMGPSTQRLVQVGYVGRGASGIDEEAWSKLSRVFQGEKTLVIRYSFGAGVDQPERALRAILPSGAGGDAATIWEPAVVFRIAQQLPHRQEVRRAMTVSTTAPGNIVGPALLLDGGQHVLADWKRGEVLLVRAGEVLASASRANVEFGKALARVGDLNADGTADIAVGAPGSSSSMPGAVVFLSGKDLEVLRELEVGGSGEMFGNILAPIGGGDGPADLLVASRGYWRGSSGKAWVVSSAEDVPLREHAGSHFAATFGTSVAAIGDLDGDGHEEYAIGAGDADGPAIDSGAVNVFSGRTGELIELVRGPHHPYSQLGAHLLGFDGGFVSPANGLLLTWSATGASFTCYDEHGPCLVIVGDRAIDPVTGLGAVEEPDGARWLVGTGTTPAGDLVPVYVEEL